VWTDGSRTAAHTSGDAARWMPRGAIVARTVARRDVLFPRVATVARAGAADIATRMAVGVVDAAEVAAVVAAIAARVAMPTRCIRRWPSACEERGRASEGLARRVPRAARRVQCRDSSCLKARRYEYK
jgi:hypothetical protein